jgi:hypothetical protein
MVLSLMNMLGLSSSVHFAHIACTDHTENTASNSSIVAVGADCIENIVPSGAFTGYMALDALLCYCLFRHCLATVPFSSESRSYNFSALFATVPIVLVTPLEDWKDRLPFNIYTPI